MHKGSSSYLCLKYLCVEMWNNVRFQSRSRCAPVFGFKPLLDLCGKRKEWSYKRDIGRGT